MKPVPFRDICVSILSAALGPARPYNEFMAWERAAGPVDQDGPQGQPRRVQLWLSAAQSGKGECELWLVDPAQSGPVRHTVRDLPELHAVLGVVHGAADGRQGAGPAGGARSPRIPEALTRAWQAMRDLFRGRSPVESLPEPPASVPFREHVLIHVARKLGPYSEVPVPGGSLYRWVLSRPDGTTMYITLDSPEIPELAHLIVSDASGTSANPVEGYTCRTLGEVDAMLDALLRQWRR